MRKRFPNPVARIRLPLRQRPHSRTVHSPQRRLGLPRRTPRIINPRVTRNAQGYLFLRVYFVQAGLAAVSLMLALWAADLLTGDSVARAVLVAAIASTAFILFIGPRSVTAHPRHSIGGHAVAVGAASAVSILAEYFSGTNFIDELSLLFGFYAALAVGAAMLLMALTDTEHAPAAGTALAIVAHGADWQLVVFLMTMVLLLAGVHALLKDRLHDFF